MPPSTAIAWLTHFSDPEVDAAFARLQREAAPWAKAFQVRHVPDGAEPPPPAADLIVVTDGELSAALPNRHMQMSFLGQTISSGFVDLVMMAAMRRLGDFERVWFVEYDVDFSGDWGDLFSVLAASDADLLGTTLYPRARMAEWFHWTWFSGPDDLAPEHEARGFFPMVRLSRTFAQTYAEQVEAGWFGHYEALYTSIALRGGLKVEDIGGDGPMTPEARRGLFYSNGADPGITVGSFRHKPPVAEAYFPNDPGRAPVNFLWHPVKTAAALAAPKWRT
jgi:hypothetical protein